MRQTMKQTKQELKLAYEMCTNYIATFMEM